MVIEPVSYQIASLILFLTAASFASIIIVKRKEKVVLPAAAAVLSMASFLFLPDIRERYLFPVLPLLLWAANYRPGLLRLYVLLTVSWLFNLVTIASFAPQWWTNLVAWERPYPLRISLLKTAAWVVSAVHLAVFFRLSLILAAVGRPHRDNELFLQEQDL
jgi:hypothetical protein